MKDIKTAYVLIRQFQNFTRENKLFIFLSNCSIPLFLSEYLLKLANKNQQKKQQREILLFFFTIHQPDKINRKQLKIHWCQSIGTIDFTFSFVLPGFQHSKNIIISSFLFTLLIDLCLKSTKDSFSVNFEFSWFYILLHKRNSCSFYLNSSYVYLLIKNTNYQK